MSSKYDVDPIRLEGKRDIVDYIKEIRDRVSNDETSLRIGHTAIEDGNLVVRNGDILVSESDGTNVLRIFHGAVPRIEFYPLGDTDTHKATLLSYDDNQNPADPSQAIILYIEKANSGPFAVDGGKLLLTKDYSILSHQPDVGEESYLWLNSDSGLPEVLAYRGKLPNQTQGDAQEGLYPGITSIGSGFSSWTHTYFTTFASTAVPMVTLQSSAIVSWMLTAFSNSSFTVSWSGTTAKTLNHWVFRV